VGQVGLHLQESRCLVMERKQDLLLLNVMCTHTTTPMSGWATPYWQASILHLMEVSLWSGPDNSKCRLALTYIVASRCHGLWQMYSTVHHIGDSRFSLIHPHSRELAKQSYFVTKNIIVIILIKLLYLQ